MVLILKIFLKKMYYFNIFSNKNHFKKQLLPLSPSWKHTLKTFIYRAFVKLYRFFKCVEINLHLVEINEKAIDIFYLILLYCLAVRAKSGEKLKSVSKWRLPFRAQMLNAEEATSH
jgi:hypothetical protein